MRIALLDPVHPRLGELLAAAGHEPIALHHETDEALRGALGDCHAIVVRSRRLTAGLLAQAPWLRAVGRLGSGLENIDTTWCAARGITVLNSPEGNRDGVGETCVMLLLALMKHLARADAQVHRGLWLREENRGTDLHGKTVGIVGFGHMGSAFAEKLAGFGVQVLAHDKYRSGFARPGIAECGLERLLAESDAVSLHLPLNDETRHYADMRFFQALGKPAWFLNTSRGPVVRTAHLLDALDEGRVIAAGLDVLEFERPDLSGLDPALEPETQRRLLGHDRVLLTPHIAGVTHEGKLKMAEVLARKMTEALAHAEP